MEKLSIKTVLKRINVLLAAKQYALLYAEDVGKRVESEEIENAISEYGGDVVAPPEEAYDNIHIYQNNETDNEVATEMYLWINGKESDLTLSCDVGTDGKIMFFAIDK